MKKTFLFIISLFALLSSNAQISFTGNKRQIIAETPESSTGLNYIYVIDNLNDVTIQYRANSSAQVTWSKFSNLGGGYAEEVYVNRSGNVTSLPLTGSGDMGYIIEEGTKRTYIWIVDYSKHQFNISSLDLSPERECDVVALIPKGNGNKITYYTINGVPKELDRDIKIAYSTLEFSQDQQTYIQRQEEKTFPFLSETMRVQAPLCNTEFTISGDRFLKRWGIQQEATSSFFTAIAVDAQTWATQVERNNDNEKKDEGISLGGSAPADITFSAAVTDAAIFKEWQTSKDAEFNEIDTRYNDTEFSHTFTEEGTTYVRFVANNAEGTCDFVGETYQVFIGESRLDCPNAFSPYGSEGVNDEWKVSYKSIISFECHIFNRWGVRITSFSDPSLGWDGKYNGKLVPAGVYYYVIKAVGSDGEKYDLAGDINIIKQKNNFSNSNNDSDVTPVE